MQVQTALRAERVAVEEEPHVLRPAYLVRAFTKVHWALRLLKLRLDGEGSRFSACLPT